MTNPLEGRGLGRRKAHLYKARLDLAPFLLTAPNHPLVDLAPTGPYPMDLNDSAGTCVVAALDHTLQTVNAALGVRYTNMTDAQIVDFYRTQNPNFDPSDPAHGGGSNDDGGMLVQNALAEAVRRGLILAFAAVDFTKPELVRAATYIGLAIITGETLTQSQLRSQVWDVASDAVIGGHSTVWAGYDPRPQAISWGELVPMTDAFIAAQVEEAWFVLLPAHLAVPGFRDHFDLAGFAAAYTALTGAPFPVAVPPSPSPAPSPSPSPAPPTPPAPHKPGDHSVALDDDVLAAVRERAHRSHESAKHYVNKVLRRGMKL